MQDMKKKWQILDTNEDCSIMESLLRNRNVKDIDDFFNNDISRLEYTSNLQGIEEARVLILRTLKYGGKIVIFGDYDVDGISSSAILYLYLSYIGFKDNVKVILPTRDDGYGITFDSLKKVYGENPDLLITVDCGTASIDELKEVKDKGINVIVIDHHQPKEELPEVDVLINPHTQEDENLFKDFCAAGLCYKLVRHISNDPTQSLLEFIEIASVATICDGVPLRRENRNLVKTGLYSLNNFKKNLGLRNLIEVAKKSEEKIESDTIGFYIGPRINSSGRLTSPQLSFDLIVEQDYYRSEQLSKELNEMNEKRKKLETEIIEFLESKINNNPKLAEGNILVLDIGDYTSGLNGIVASRISEKYSKSTIILSKNKNSTVYTGSARSFGKADILDSIKLGSRLLVKFGGHKQAAGLKIEEYNIDKFREIINSSIIWENSEDNCKVYEVDRVINKEDLTWETMNIIEKFKPFGIENPEPALVIKNVIFEYPSLMGSTKEHFSGMINRVKAVGFYKPELINITSPVDLLVKIKTNSYKGKTYLQVMIEDYKISQ